MVDVVFWVTYVMFAVAAFVFLFLWIRLKEKGEKTKFQAGTESIRLQQENASLRDACRKAEGQAAGYLQEIAMLRQQLDDMQRRFVELQNSVQLDSLRSEQPVKFKTRISTVVSEDDSEEE